MWQEWYKEGKVFTFEMYAPHFCEIHKTFRCLEHPDREYDLLSKGFMPVFDRRWLHKINGKSGAVILENDTFAPERLVKFQEEIVNFSFKPSEQKIFTSLHPNHLPEIMELIDNKKVKNILIDSLFKDIEQFRFLINKLFCNYTDLNFFIYSRGALFDVLKEELNNHMDKYPVRNSYYKNFNDLTFTLLKNYIYEIDFEGSDTVLTATRIKYERIENTIEYGKKFKVMHGQYKTDDSDIFPEETKKSKWTE